MRCMLSFSIHTLTHNNHLVSSPYLSLCFSSPLKLPLQTPAAVQPRTCRTFRGGHVLGYSATAETCHVHRQMPRDTTNSKDTRHVHGRMPRDTTQAHTSPAPAGAPPGPHDTHVVPERRVGGGSGLPYCKKLVKRHLWHTNHFCQINVWKD